TPCAIPPGAPWAALCAARSAAPPLAESWAVVEGRDGGPALVRLSVAPHAAFKGLRSSTAPMHIACVGDGRESELTSAARFSAAFLRQCRAFSVDHKIAGDRHCVSLGRQQQLKAHVRAMQEFKLDGSEIELPHAAESLIIDRRRLRAVLREALAPVLHRVAIMKPQHFHVIAP